MHVLIALLAGLAAGDSTQPTPPPSFQLSFDPGLTRAQHDVIHLESTIDNVALLVDSEFSFLHVKPNRYVLVDRPSVLVAG